MSKILLEKGTLWHAIRARSAQALQSGDLQPIATRSEMVESQGVRFVVRMLTRLERKLEARDRAGKNFDPFLPYDESLFVGDVTTTHVCLLNKFNVLADHALIVTRRFEEQTSPLKLDDFEALWACLAEENALGFYNAGRMAGASQRHRHLQLIPLPQGVQGDDIPFAPLIESSVYRGRVGSIPGLPFVHAVARLDACEKLGAGEAAAYSQDLYEELQHAVACDAGECPYNLLMSRDWMLLVPRTRESWHAVPANALGFAGILMVRTVEQLELLKQRGPFALLSAVARSISAGDSAR